MPGEMESRAGVAPASAVLQTAHCAARPTGQKLKARASAFELARVVCLLASLIRSLLANKVRDHGRNGRVKADHVEHAAVVRVGEGEPVGGHAYNDCLRVTDQLTAILTQCLRQADVACP